MPGILELLGGLLGGNQRQEPPSYSQYKMEILDLPPGEQTEKQALKRAIELGFPRPYEAAEAAMKSVYADRKQLKELMPKPPEGSQPATGFNVALMERAGIPPDITNLLTTPMLPQPQISETGLRIMPNVSQLPRRYLLPEEGGNIPGPVLTQAAERLTALPPRAGITQIPIGTETITYITDPATGLPITPFSRAPREILSPRDEAFSKLTPTEQREALLKPEVEIKLPSPGEREKIVESKTWQSLLGKYKTAFEKSGHFTGPIAGQAKYKLFTTGGGLGLSKEESEFYTTEAELLNILIPMVTGAAVGPEEEKRIKSQIPQHTDAPEQWLVKYKLTIENAIELEERIKNIMGDYGIGKPANKPTGTIKWLPEK